MMVNVNSLVLITTATKPPNGVYGLKMTDVARRKITAKGAVFFWAVSGIKKIVIADATGQTLLDESDAQMLKLTGVEIEQIHYQQDEAGVIEKGKGYGEGALIKFALEHSKLLHDVDHFFKCTGKVYCRNFSEISTTVQQSSFSNIFWREALHPSFVDTRFYYASKKFTRDFLLPAYEKIDDKSGFIAERCVMKLVREKLMPGASIRPMLSGFSGTFNQPYFESSLGYLDQHMPCWLGR